MKSPAYDEDFYEWTQRTAELLREAKMDEIDAEHIAEELQDMGNRDKREVVNRLAVLIAHLLKWQIQPYLRGRSWKSTIVEQRSQLELVLEDSPSLRNHALKQIESVYRRAVQVALAETGLNITLPDRCPFTLDQILDNDYLPTD
jgi:hypothetical protein